MASLKPDSPKKPLEIALSLLPPARIPKRLSWPSHKSTHQFLRVILLSPEAKPNLNYPQKGKHVGFSLPFRVFTTREAFRIYRRAQQWQKVAQRLGYWNNKSARLCPHGLPLRGWEQTLISITQPQGSRDTHLKGENTVELQLNPLYKGRGWGEKAKNTQSH